MTRKVQLLGEGVDGIVSLIDDEDYAQVSHWKWYWDNPNNYAMKTTGGYPHHLHRYIMSMYFDVSGKVIDHINRNGLDNRKENLRLCTYSQNGMNTEKREWWKSSSRYKGVSRLPDGKWQSQIACNKIKIPLGIYTDEMDAARAYDFAAVEHFGEFPSLNFPNEIQRVPFPNRIYRSKRSKFIGISYISTRNSYKKWKVCFRCQGRNIQGGYFESEIDAAKAYDQMAVEYFGEAAKLNFPIVHSR